MKIRQLILQIGSTSGALSGFILALSGCSGTVYCDDEGVMVPGTDCRCGTRYKVEHPCCTGPNKKDTTDCVLANGQVVEAGDLNKDDEDPPDEAPEEPAVSYYVEIWNMIAVNAQGGIGFPEAGTDFSVQWQYANPTNGTLYPPDYYEIYSLATLDAPTFTVNSSPEFNEEVPWGQLEPAATELRNVGLNLPRGSYVAEIINVPLRDPYSAAINVEVGFF